MTQPSIARVIWRVILTGVLPITGFIVAVELLNQWLARHL